MKRFTRIFSLVFAIAVFVLYAQCLCFAHIGLDDAAYTFRNPFVAGGLSVGNVTEAFANLRHGGIWMPVTYVSYMLDASICHLTGLPFIGEMHLVNVLLHVVNFLLLVKLLSLLPSQTHQTPTLNPQLSTLTPHPSTLNSQLSTPIVVFAAMIWAVHPLRVEPVAWIAARKELLWTLFTLSGLICWIKGLKRGMRDEEKGMRDERGSLNSQLSSILFCALACLSKPTAMCFPLLALLVAWRMGYFALGRRGAKSFTFNSQLTAFVLIALATGIIAAYSQTHVAGRESAALYAAPFMYRLINAFSAIGYYIRVTFWPSGLHVDCRSVAGLWPLEAGWNFLVLGIAAVTALGMMVARRRKLGTIPNQYPISGNTFLTSHPLIFSSCWFLFALLPTLGIFGSFGIEAHADRFTYLPAMAFSILIVESLKSKVGSRESGDENGTPDFGLRIFDFRLLPFGLIVILLSVVTFQQLSCWRDDAVAHLRALTCDPEHPRAMVHVADARCSRQKDFDGGIRLYRQALARANTVPKGGFDVEDVTAKLAYALATRGREEDFAEVKRLGAAVLRDTRLDRRGLMLDALGTAFMHEGDSGRAAQLFKASIAAPDRFWPKVSTQRKLELIVGR